jgi:hypothetical protein
MWRSTSHNSIGHDHLSRGLNSLLMQSKQIIDMFQATKPITQYYNRLF